VNAIGLALALALNRALKTRHFLRAVFFAPVILSPLALSYVWQWMFMGGLQEGALNRLLAGVGLGSLRHQWLADPSTALWSVLVVMVWQYTGLAMVVYLAGLQAIPDELVEAAYVDGASAWDRLRRVVLPLLAPAITIAGTLTLIIGLRQFDQVWALTNGGGPVFATENLATQTYKQSFVFGRFGYGAAFALILTALVAALALMQLALLRRNERRL
jgi:raffinose/stachyose/melibiose transport system permease protein